MWIILALLSALFAGLTSITAKVGTEKVNSNLLTALRTGVVLIFSWLMAAISGGIDDLSQLTAQNIIFLVLSGLCTGFSWLCYFHALKIGDVNKVVPVDKLSTVLTIVLSFIILGEPVNIFTILAILLIAAGTLMMITKKKSNVQKTAKNWFLYAAGSAVFASLTSILAKIGVQNVSSDLATAIRTVVVLIMAWAIVFSRHEQRQIKSIDKKGWLFTILSGLCTGLSWLCYYRAIQDGYASVVVPIDKLSVVITFIFAIVFLKERPAKKEIIGLIILVGGTMLTLIK